MNYSPFLNKKSNKSLTFKDKNQYRLSNKKKNGKIFLISSVLSIAVMTTFVTLLTDNTQPANAHKVDTVLTSEQVTPLALPEIGYQSEVLSQAVVYAESESDATPVDKVIAIQKVNEPTPPVDKKVVAAKEEPLVENENVQQGAEVSIAKVEAKPIQTQEPGSQKAPQQAHNEVAPAPKLASKTIIVKKGDTLSAIFKRHSLSGSSLYKIINSGKEAKKLTRIKPGQKFTVALDNENKIDSLKFEFNKVETLVVSKKGKTFASHIETKEIDVVQQFTSGTINNSLFMAGKKAGLNSAMIMKLAHVFGWDIDFALDIRKGDSFAVLYEEKFIDGKKIGYGNILSAEFVNNGKEFKAIRYTDDSGHTDYYSEDGLSMRKAFLRTPVEFSRISSRFSSGRKHPVLNRVRAHKGVDYAASRGTPIKAVGDGKVSFKGRKGGYGKVIILQHGSKYTTLYAHMNSYNKKLRNGSRVKQGQTIGYVGSSGLATGPHLHYEFRVNGVHRNPLTVSLPSATPISKKYRTDFKAAAETMISQLKLRKQETIALKEQ